MHMTTACCIFYATKTVSFSALPCRDLPGSEDRLEWTAVLGRKESEDLQEHPAPRVRRDPRAMMADRVTRASKVLLDSQVWRVTQELLVPQERSASR